MGLGLLANENRWKIGLIVSSDIILMHTVQCAPPSCTTAVVVVETYVYMCAATTATTTTACIRGVRRAQMQ